MRIVSIIPGIETAAPLRTETSSGAAASPRLPAAALLERRERGVDLLLQPSGQAPPECIACTQAAVVIVKPSGTGRPSRVISASPAPLPPSSSFGTSAASAKA